MGTDGGDMGGKAVLRTDLMASVVVFLVALPLCMGIAIASGVPIAAGLITGIVGGIIVGLLAGSPLQVSGPAAGLTVVIYGLVQQHGLPALGPIVLLAGIVQVLFGLAHLGQWFRAVSPAVIKGMLSGIGVLIFASQFHVMVDDKPRRNGVENLLTIPEAIRKGLPFPEFGTQAARQSRLEFLKRFGQLHELQVEVHEAVDETISEHAAEHAAQLHADFSFVLEKQRQIAQQTKTLAAAVEEQSATWTNGRSDEIVQNAKVALARTSEAWTILESNNIAEARAGQRAAQSSLEDMLGSLKNHDWAAKLGLLTIVLIVLWQTLFGRKLRMIPAPLVAVIAVTALAYLLDAPVLYVEVPARLWDGIHFPTTTILEDMAVLELVTAALVVAAIASAETLLCATAIDQMHNGVRTKYDRELTAQGIGNIVCGMLGALPMTGVIVRSAANLQAGATTRLSAVLHGVWLLLFVAFLANVLTLIPTAALAGILVYTGYKLIHPSTIRELWQFGMSEVFIYLATVIVIVTEDLLIGVLTGIVLSAVRLLIRFSRLQVKLQVDLSDNRASMQLEGAATFLRLPVLAAKLERVPPGIELHMDVSRLDYIDHGCLELLINWTRQHESTGGQVFIDWDTLHARFGRIVHIRQSSGH